MFTHKIYNKVKPTFQNSNLRVYNIKKKDQEALGLFNKNIHGTQERHLEISSMGGYQLLL